MGENTMKSHGKYLFEINTNKMRRVFITSEVFRLIKPIFCISRLFGLIPVSFKLVGNQYAVFRSRNYVIYSLSLVTVLGVLTILGVYNDIQLGKTDSVRIKDGKAKYVVSADVGVVIITVIFGVLLSSTKTEKLFNIMECLNYVNATFQIHEKIRRCSMKMSITIYSLFVSVLVFDISAWHIVTSGRPEYRHVAQNYFTFYCLYVVIISQENVYSQMAYFVSQYIVALKKNLARDVATKCNINIPNIPDSPIIGIYKIITEEERIFPMNSKRSMRYPLTANKLNSYILFYDKLYQCVDAINDYFGIPVLLIIFSCFMHLIVTPYVLVTQNNKKTPGLFMILQILWIFTHIGRLLLILEPTCRCLEECKKLKLMVCRMTSKTTNLDLLHKLQLFALHLEFCDIQFTTCGIFAMNRRILATIAAAITTYVVILIQFKD